MFCTLNIQKQNQREEIGILSNTTTETDQIGETITTRENQACFNLCELSDHICESSMEIKERAMFPERYRFSPWRLKEGKKKIHVEQERKMNERAGVSQREQPIYRPKQRYSKHENKENLFTAKSYTRPYDELSKYPDIVNRLYTLKQGKMASKPKINREDPSIQIITCMKKKPNLKKIMCNNKIMVEQEDGQILPYSHQKSLVKYDKNSHREVSTNQNSNSQQNLINSKQEKDNRGDTHAWRIRSQSKNGDKSKLPQMLISKEIFRERDGCTETINVGKCSINLIEKSKQDNYSGSNPLSRLLYYKYLHTISVDHAPKDGRKKFL